MQLADATTVGGAGCHVGYELCDVGPDACFEARAKVERVPVDGLGGRAQFETGLHTDAEESSQHDAGALDCYGEKFKVAAVTGRVVQLAYVDREELALGIRGERVAHKVMLETSLPNMEMSMATPSLS